MWSCQSQGLARISSRVEKKGSCDLRDVITCNVCNTAVFGSTKEREPCVLIPWRSKVMKLSLKKVGWRIGWCMECQRHEQELHIGHALQQARRGCQHFAPMALMETMYFTPAAFAVLTAVRHISTQESVIGGQQRTGF